MLRLPRSLRLPTLGLVAVCTSFAACEIPLGNDEPTTVYEPVMGPTVTTEPAAPLPLPSQAPQLTGSSNQGERWSPEPPHTKQALIATRPSR